MTSAEPTDPSAYDSPIRRELRRSTRDRMIGGVCGGLADYTGIDAVLWRVGFVVVTLLGGAGIFVYLLLWVLMPSEPLQPGQTVSAVEQFVGRLHGAVSGIGQTPPGR